jgi:hypothetical protein
MWSAPWGSSFTWAGARGSWRTGYGPQFPYLVAYWLICKERIRWGTGRAWAPLWVTWERQCFREGERGGRRRYHDSLHERFGFRACGGSRLELGEAVLPVLEEQCIDVEEE